MNIEINKPFTISKKVLLPKNSFIGSEIYKGLKIEFCCAVCSTKNYFKVDSFKNYNILENLFKENNFISKESIIKNGLALQSKKFQTHLGDLVVDKFAANYFIFKCENCKKDYIVVFGIGESQPGKSECYISGIWGIDF